MSALRGWQAPGSGLEALPTTELTVGTRTVSVPSLTAADTDRLCTLLVEAGGPLTDRPARELVGLLGCVGARFAAPADPLRREALDGIEATTGLSPEMCVAVLDGMARDWTAERLDRLLREELEAPEVLDGWREKRGRKLLAVGPKLCVQIVSGSVPGVGVTALLRSLLVKGPTLLKPGAGDLVLPLLFAGALEVEAPDVARALAVVYWPGGSSEVEASALARADVITAYGSDATVRALRERSPVTARFVGYHHRESVGVVGSEALTEERIGATAESVAHAVALFDQRGCVSPRLLFVEDPDGEAAGRFGGALADALLRLEARLPGGPLDVEEAGALQQLRGTVELVSGAGSVEVHHGGPDGSWTVVIEREGADPIDHSCVGRVVTVRPLPDLAALPLRLEAIGAHLQSMGVAGLGDRLDAVTASCARVGVTRVSGFPSMAFPPAWWLHDGRGPITDLVRWAEVERA